jgi:hypothetical protein
MNYRVGPEGGKHFTQLLAIANIHREELEFSTRFDLFQIGALEFRRVVFIKVIDNRDAFAFEEQSL